DPLVPNEVRYQAALRSDCCCGHSSSARIIAQGILGCKRPARNSFEKSGICEVVRESRTKKRRLVERRKDHSRSHIKERSKPSGLPMLWRPCNASAHRYSKYRLGG